MKNRIIKFRAWDTKNNWMCSPSYGDWIAFDGNTFTEASKTYDTPNIEIERTDDYILMQFTGLLDKNGTEIYEGDIVETALYGVAEVVWPEKYITGDNEDILAWCLNSPTEIGLRGLDMQSDYLVIGNIYENSELLKEPEGKDH